MVTTLIYILIFTFGLGMLLIYLSGLNKIYMSPLEVKLRRTGLLVSIISFILILIIKILGILGILLII